MLDQHLPKLDAATIGAAFLLLLDALPKIEAAIVGALAIVWWLYRIRRERRAK